MQYGTTSTEKLKTGAEEHPAGFTPHFSSCLIKMPMCWPYTAKKSQC